MHIVVVGAGMGGLAAAAAAASADRVTVLDGDTLPHGVAVRRGTPQARHIHALLAGGREALEDLLPGFDAALEEAGAPEVTHGGGFGFHGPEGWLRDVPDLRLRCASRPALEAAARRLVREHDHVEVRGGWHVGRPTTDTSGRIAGVVGTSEGRPAALAADLVIDASGRGSAAPAWLADLGHEPPVERVVDPRLWYATMRGYGTPDLPGDLEALVIMPSADAPAGGGMIPTEDGGYVVSLTGVGDQRPPRTEAAFREHARRLPSPVLAQAIAGMQLRGPIAYSRSTANRLRRFDRVALPPGLLILGDSVCALDPVFGQGMTVAAVQARSLRSLLGELGPRHPELGTRFQRAAWGIAKLAWDQATAAERRLPTVDDHVPLAARPVGAYVRRVQRRCTVDQDTARRVGRVMHLLDPPTGLFHPRIAAGVLRDLVRHPRPRQGPAATTPTARSA